MMAEVPSAPKGAIEVPQEGVKGLTDWRGLSEFVLSFNDPLAALVGVGLICVSVVALGLGTVWIVCSTIKSMYRTQREMDIELAKIGQYRDGGRRQRWIWALLVVFLILLVVGAIGSALSGSRW
jgi:hypothetical protein